MKQNLLIATILVLLVALIYQCNQGSSPTPGPVKPCPDTIRIMQTNKNGVDCDTSICIPNYVSTPFADSLRDHSFDITRADAITMHDRYLAAKTTLTNSGTDTLIKLTYGEVFSRAALLDLLSRDNVSGIYFTHGLDNEKRSKLIAIPALSDRLIDSIFQKEATPMDSSIQEMLRSPLRLQYQ